MQAFLQTPQVRTLLLTDLVDSAQLVERLGDTASAELFRAHDRVVLDLQQRWRGRLIDRPATACCCCSNGRSTRSASPLDYVRGLRDLGRERQPNSRCRRAGLHVGEVLVWENSPDAVRLGAKSR